MTSKQVIVYRKLIQRVNSQQFNFHTIGVKIFTQFSLLQNFG